MTPMSGVGRMVWASLCFALMAALLKVASGRVSTAEIMLARSALPLPFLLVLLWRERLTLVPRNWRLVFLRSLFGTIAMALSFYAFGRLPLADAVLLQQAQPILVALVALIFLRETASPATLVSLAASIVGVGFILQPSLEVGNVAGVLMLLSSLSSAFAMVSIRRVSADDAPLVIVTGFSVFTTLVTLPVAGASFVVPSLSDAAALAGVALFATLGQLLMTGAYAIESAAVVAAASYLSVVFSVALVLTGGFLLVRSRRRVAPQAYPRSID
jgi:drug/metabolite transporter (DMT)-like permease